MQSAERSGREARLATHYLAHRELRRELYTGDWNAVWGDGTQGRCALHTPREPGRPRGRGAVQPGRRSTYGGASVDGPRSGPGSAPSSGAESPICQRLAAVLGARAAGGEAACSGKATVPKRRVCTFMHCNRCASGPELRRQPMARVSASIVNLAVAVLPLFALHNKITCTCPIVS